MDMVGRKLGRFEITGSLGAGGMGEVWKARDEQLGREVAVKVLSEQRTDDPKALARFEREARAVAALSHPNILSIFDYGHEGDLTYAVMELLKGETLQAALSRGPLPVSKCVEAAGQIAKGLAAAHEKSIVHRDLKPANIFLTNDGQVKILDFGLARVDEPSPETGGSFSDKPTVEEHTRPGVVMGTVGYMSPEQARGLPADARSDLFAFGVVLYEMLSGRKAFHGATASDTLAAILVKDPDPLPPVTPPGLDRIVRRCLEKRPEDRFSTAHDLALALESASTASAPTLPATAVPRMGWRVPALIAGALCLAILAILLAINAGGLRNRLSGVGKGTRSIRMAVLPFANLSGDPEQEYLSDGLTQEMITQLGSLHPEGLSVIARTSVMRYKKTDTPIDRIGKDLGVDYVLEGSVRREGNRIRVTVELVQVRDQSQLWAQTYERELSGILPLQTDVARSVADALALRLLPSEQAQLAGARAVNPEAYEAYLKGSQYWTRLTAADLDTAEHYFDLALEKDPKFAPAHAGLAMVWACRQQMGFTPPSEAAPKAKSEARRALEMDDTVAQAHFALATVLTWSDWDFPAAGREWARAIELDPGDALARANYSHYLMIVGHPDEAMRQIGAASKADPFNVMVRIFYSVDLIFLRRYEEALAASRECLRMQPGAPAALQVTWLTSARLGKRKEAVDAAKEYLVVVYQDDRAAQACDEGYSRGGYTEAMRRAAETLAGRFRTSFALPSDIAWYYLGAGDIARTLDWLEKGYEVRDPVLPYLGWGFYDELRFEPRFQALVRQMNLPPSAPATSAKRAEGAP